MEDLKRRVIRVYIQKGLLPRKEIIDKIMKQLEALDEKQREESLKIMEEC